MLFTHAPLFSPKVLDMYAVESIKGLINYAKEKEKKNMYLIWTDEVKKGGKNNDDHRCVGDIKLSQILNFFLKVLVLCR